MAAKAGTRTRKVTPGTIALQRRRAQALELRSQRMTYRQIATRLGVTVHTAHDDVQKAMAEVIIEPAETVRYQELEQLDILARRLMPMLERASTAAELANERINNGTTKSESEDERQIAESISDATKVVNSLIKIQERRSKLHGLDAPTQTNITGTPFTIAVDPNLLPQGADLSGVNNHR